DVGRPRKHPTHPIRVRKDLAEDLQRIAGALGLDVADMVDDSLRKLADSRRDEAARTIMNKKARAAQKAVYPFGQACSIHAMRSSLFQRRQLPRRKGCGNHLQMQ